MVRESLRVPLLMFRLVTSSNNLHKTADNTNVYTEEDECLDSNVFGRHAYDRLNDRRNSTIFGFCFKTGEVHFESSSGNRVPSGINKFLSAFTKRESAKNSQSMSGYLCQK